MSGEKLCKDQQRTLPPRETQRYWLFSVERGLAVHVVERLQVAVPQHDVGKGAGRHHAVHHQGLVGRELEGCGGVGNVHRANAAGVDVAEDGGVAKDVELEREPCVGKRVYTSFGNPCLDI